MSIRGIGHTEYPFLDQIYSPGSRIPCKDFSCFIAGCLRIGDIQSVIRLFCCLISGNPGIGIGADWASDAVQEINNIPLKDYVEAVKPHAIYELKALFILSGLGGGPRNFNITHGIPTHIAQALSCYEFNWLEPIREMRETVNRFIRKMRKDTPFWKEYPLIKTKVAINHPFPQSELAGLLENMSPTVRALVFCFGEEYRWSISKSISYGERKFGINAKEAYAEIDSTDLCLHKASEPSLLLKAWEKEDFIKQFNELGIELKSSWTKTRLLEELQKNKPELIENYVRQESAVCINSKYINDMAALRTYAKFLEDNIKALFFA